MSDKPEQHIAIEIRARLTDHPNPGDATREAWRRIELLMADLQFEPVSEAGYVVYVGVVEGEHEAELDIQP